MPSIEQFPASRADRLRHIPPRPERKAADPNHIWVSEGELPAYVPFSSRQIRDMRKRGVLKYYRDPRPGRRMVVYNLHEVSELIRSGRCQQPRHRAEFDPEAVEISI